MKLVLTLLLGAFFVIVPVTKPDMPVTIVEYVRPTPPREATLIAVGDLMLSRTVAKRMNEKGADYPFLETRAFLESADITFGNLETPITPGEPVQPFEMSFRADPSAAPALKKAGFDILSLANNHTPNFGVRGLGDTFRLLGEEGILYVGAGNNATEAAQTVFMNANGILFAFLAYNDDDVVPREYEAGDGPGTAFMRTERMQEAVAGAVAYADIVIVSMHSGTEYEPTPNASQVAFARAAIDAGATIVIGHHPHVVQTVEYYKGKPIFYSLGNFVFDQMFSRETREGLALKAVFTKKGLKDITYHPVLIEDYAQPRLLEGAEKDAVIARLQLQTE
jgi:poly-gamma-glutamate synthesis protein (capsule biosynthesis protein)